METKTLDSGKEKVDLLCKALIDEAIEPAKKQAKTIVDEAEEQARKRLHEAEQQANSFMAEARAKIESERKLFKTSLEQAARQSLEKLRQDIEERFFSVELQELIQKDSSQPDIVAKLIQAIISHIDKEGLSSDLSAVIARETSPERVNELLTEKFVGKLRQGGVQVGDFRGGATVILNDKRMTLDMTDDTLKELMTGFLKESFRELFFAKGS